MRILKHTDFLIMFSIQTEESQQTLGGNRKKSEVCKMKQNTRDKILGISSRWILPLHLMPMDTGCFYDIFKISELPN